ncbi:MAG: SGNH/GDSL hydrolase family protein [Flavobacteriales bacterium]|nr:SGNH/GDSL hydrolase family protein [Flavobacteriales bacterium]
MNKNKIIFNLFYTLGLLLFIEIVLRICFPLPEFSNFNRINYQILDRKDDNSGYLRNIEMIWKSSLDTNYEFVHELNKYGYRDELDWEKKKKKGKKRILFVGDSFVEGMMSTADRTIPKGFEKAAQEEGVEIEAFNCGMMGIGLNEYIKFIQDAVPIFKPDELIMVLYSNDAPFQREFNPQIPLKPSKRSIWKLRFLEILTHIKKEDPIPFVFAPEKRPFYKSVPDPGNPWTENTLSLQKEVSPKIAEAMKKGDFNYFRTNWILEEEKFLKSEVRVKSKLEYLKKIIINRVQNLRFFTYQVEVKLVIFTTSLNARLVCKNALTISTLLGPNTKNMQELFQKTAKHWE